jgi:hypothetical protein
MLKISQPKREIMRKLLIIEKTQKMSALEGIQIKNIDHLGIVAGIIDEIGIVEVINEKLGIDKSTI